MKIKQLKICRRCGNKIKPGKGWRNAAIEPDNLLPYCSESCASIAYAGDSIKATNKIMVEFNSKTGE